jgi:hypothetical protein
MHTLEEIYDYYQAVVYEREILVGAFERLVSALGVRAALDCARGTGLPSIDLRSRGFDVDCRGCVLSPRGVRADRTRNASVVSVRG